MSGFFYLIPVSLVLAVGGLIMFLWSLRSRQYEDLDGAASRILFDEDVPLGRKDTPSNRPAPRDRAGEA